MSSALIYKMRLTAPNKPGTASHNSNYVKYIAEREHVMKLSPESESGLFGRIDGTNNDELDVTDTQNYVYGISKAGVTVYNAYISFRPEIAKRLELDSLEKWQNYIKFHIETLMRGYDISKTQYATWRYSFYPKSEYFTGLNLGHYFSNEISAKTDYFERLSEMGNRLKSEISKTCCETDEDMEI